MDSFLSSLSETDAGESLKTLIEHDCTGEALEHASNHVQDITEARAYTILKTITEQEKSPTRTVLTNQSAKKLLAKLDSRNLDKLVILCLEHAMVGNIDEIAWWLGRCENAQNGSNGDHPGQIRLTSRGFDNVKVALPKLRANWKSTY